MIDLSKLEVSEVKGICTDLNMAAHCADCGCETIALHPLKEQPAPTEPGWYYIMGDDEGVPTLGIVNVDRKDGKLYVMFGTQRYPIAMIEKWYGPVPMPEVE